MTRNQNIDCREYAAKVLFKNSLNTLHTYSKTYSGASQIFTKSLLLQLKQNLPKDNYYEDNGTVKRDLSIETDICIMRRYCRRKRNQLINRATVSTKSKYSINRTENDTIDEFKHDTSACGDSEQQVNLPSACFNINLTSIVIDNLKTLLSDWIKTYLLEKNETKQKIDTVLDSILHKLELQANDHDTSSSYTYNVDVEVVNHDSNQKIKVQSNSLKHTLLNNTKQVQDTSNLSIPLNGKYLRIISTLSLPRHAHRIKRCRNSREQMKKLRHKKILLSLSKSSNYIFKSSNLDFLMLPTKSLTKHCVTCDQDKNKKPIVNDVEPQPLIDIKNLIDDSTTNKNSTNGTVRKIKENRSISNSNKIKNYYQNIYSDDSQDTLSNSASNQEKELVFNNKNIMKKTDHDQDLSDPLITIDLVNQSFECQDRNTKGLKTSNKPNTYKAKCRKSSKCKKNLSKYKYVKSKQFTYLFKKSNNLINQEKTILKHFQSIMRYFSNWEGNKDVKVDIHVNIFPSQENKKDNCNHLEESQTTTLNPDRNQKLTFETTANNNENLYGKQNIISLLDSTVSQAKYIIRKETSTDTSETNNKVNSEKSLHDVKHTKISQEINEIKVIIKSLATATEKIANDHLKRKQSVIKDTVNVLAEPAKKTSNENLSNTVKTSKYTQFSSISPRSELISGIKIKKEPKSKSVKNYNPRLLKKSTSYRIIDSESILKVTDMTSAAQDFTRTTETLVDAALTCSLPKSKSLFDVSMGPDKNKLLAFYCDDFFKPKEHRCNHNISYYANSCKEKCRHIKPLYIYSNCNRDTHCNNDICHEDADFVCTELTSTHDDCGLCNGSSSSVCIDIDSKSSDKKIKIRNCSSMGFWEGCLYCFFLWIPLLLIAWLFYIHVLKDFIEPKHSILRRLYLPKHYTSETFNDIPVKLADLGF